MEGLPAAFILAAIAIYFAPSFVAVFRHHHQGTAILVLNIALGWTGLGWIAALVWSFSATRETG